jgi:hypothetical protein
MIEQTCQKYKIRIKNLHFLLNLSMDGSHIGYTTKLIRNQNPNNYYTPHTPQRTHTIQNGWYVDKKHFFIVLPSTFVYPNELCTQHQCNAPTWSILHVDAGGCWNCLMRRKPSFGLGLLSGFPLRKLVGAFTQGVTLDMVGIFLMCWSIRFDNLIN